MSWRKRNFIYCNRLGSQQIGTVPLLGLFIFLPVVELFLEDYSGEEKL